MSLTDTFHMRRNIQPETGRSRLADTAWHQACAGQQHRGDMQQELLKFFMVPLQGLCSRAEFVAPSLNQFASVTRLIHCD